MKALLVFGLAAVAFPQTAALENRLLHGYIAQLSGRVSAMPGPYSPALITDFQAGNRCATHEPQVYSGGRMYVPAALIRAVRNEAELAGMLAQAAAYQPVFASGITVLNSCGPVPFRLREGQREGQLAADRVAVSRMAEAGFDPHALFDYLSRTAPDDASRLALLREAIEELPASPVTYGDQQAFDAARAELERVDPKGNR